VNRLRRDVKAVVVSTPEGVMPAIRHELESRGGHHIMLARHLECSQKHLSQMMQGKAGVSLPMLFKMLDYLDLAIILSPEESE
jgi:hypothetical protein